MRLTAAPPQVASVTPPSGSITGALTELAVVFDQKADDTEFGHGQTDVAATPFDPARSLLEHQVAAAPFRMLAQSAPIGVHVGDASQAPCQHVEAAGLVDEIAGAVLQCILLALRQRSAGEERDRHRDAAGPQLRQQFHAVKAGQRPVEHQDVGMHGEIGRGEQRSG